MAQAQPGRTYAQIVNGKLHWKFTASELPEWNNDHAPAIDITDHDPQPEQGWVWNGATFDPPPVPPAPILTCSPWQIRKALTQAGLRASVESAIAAADQTTQDGWEYATEFRRDDPLVIGMGAALGKTDAELDALFALAKTL